MIRRIEVMQTRVGDSMSFRSFQLGDFYNGKEIKHIELRDDGWAYLSRGTDIILMVNQDRIELCEMR